MRIVPNSTPSAGRWLPLLSLTLLIVACSGREGSAGDGATVRTVTVAMTDDLRFEPDAFTVAAGETVRFEVTNEGASAHEFLIGDEAAQAEFEEAMRGEMDHATDAGVSLDPGMTGSFEYTFSSTMGDLLAGCHEPGHYDAGMVASITVTD